MARKALKTDAFSKLITKLLLDRTARAVYYAIKS